VAVFGPQLVAAGCGDHHLVYDEWPELLHQVQRE
jgi:hypothetical protein